jgi:peptide/nickel transport system substrate-binding protein
MPEPDGLALVKFLWFFQIAPSYFNEHRFPERQWGYLSEAGPYGTGPFKLVEGVSLLGKPSERQVLEAYENYWDTRFPKLRRIVFENGLARNREEAMRLCREEEERVDLVDFIRPLDTLKIAESRFAKVVKSRDVSALTGFMNQRKKESIFRDIRVRKAINYAINRKELSKYAAKGNAFNLGGFLPPGAYGYNPEIAPYQYNTKRAKELLSEAGCEENPNLKIITYEAWKLEAQIMGKMFERIGLRVEFEILKWPDFWGRIYIPSLDRPPEEQLWDLAIFINHDLYGHTGASILPYPFIEEGDLRWIEYDAEYEKMFKSMAMTINRASQERKIQQMLVHLYDQAHCLFIYSPISLYAANKEVNFVPQKRKWLRLKETSVTENHWSLRGKNN